MERRPVTHTLAFELAETAELEHFDVVPNEFGNKRNMSKVAVMRPRMAAGRTALELRTALVGICPFIFQGDGSSEVPL
ncbi:hypothetical protein MTO96_030927 [Rhipicephalus appendiculatus]